MAKSSGPKKTTEVDQAYLVVLLEKLDDKLKAKALNGGFDALVEKINSIDESLRDPDVGVFSRIKNNDNKIENVVSSIKESEDKIVEINTWKKELYAKDGFFENNKLDHEFVKKLRAAVDKLMWAILLGLAGLIVQFAKSIYDAYVTGKISH
jgi:hypothetical protein